MVKRFLTAGAVVLASATMALAPVGAASATGFSPTLPSYETLFLTSCSPAGQLYRIDAATALGTPIGPGNPSVATDRCPLPGAFNPVDGKYYFIEPDSTFTLNTLFTVNVVTGIYTPVFTTSEDIYQIAIDNQGEAFTTSGGVLQHINLATGELTPIGGSGYSDYCFGINPATNDITVVDYSSGAISTISKTTGVRTPTGRSVTYPNGEGCYAMSIDDNGVAWMSDGNDPYPLFATDLATGETTGVIGNLSNGIEGLAATNFMIGVTSAKPSLPDTGLSSSTRGIASAIVGLLFTAGLAVFAGLRLRRR